MSVAPSFGDDLESIAYCIIELLIGNLPWSASEDPKDQRKKKLTLDEVFKMKKHISGRALCKGWNDVFGEFLDYSRSLGHDDTPDYQTWFRRFQALSPTLQDNILYLPEDCSEPEVGCLNTDVVFDESMMKKDTSCAPEDVGMKAVDVLGDPYEGPSGKWENAYTLEEDEVFGEQDHMTVMAVEQLDCPPTCKYPSLHTECDPEEIYDPEEI